MTTVCSDGKTIAADSRMTFGDKVATDRRIKLYHLGDGIAGFSGHGDEILMYLEALAKGEKPPSANNINGLKLTNKGLFLMNGPNCIWTRIKAPFAIGTGGDVAMGAMLAGASSAKAIKLAAKVDVFTGGTIRSFSKKAI